MLTWHRISRHEGPTGIEVRSTGPPIKYSIMLLEDEQQGRRASSTADQVPGTGNGNCSRDVYLLERHFRQVAIQDDPP